MYLINYYNNIKGLVNEDIVLDFIDSKWFDINLFSVLSAICTEAKGNGNSIVFKKMPKGLRNALLKNRYAEVLNENISGSDDDEIGYKVFESTDLIGFSDYIEKEVLVKKQLPIMSKKLKLRLNDSLGEVFGNVKMHTDGLKVHCCGQVLEESHRLDFSIVNIGKTIKQNVLDYFAMQEDECLGNKISWAVKNGNSTKINKTGGIGLSILTKFIELNKGKLQIISDNEFWESDFENDRINERSFSNSFNGTIINIEVNINDTNAYILKNEIHEDDIF